TDKDAPFFKSADFGVIGDAFTVVPKLTEAINRFKNSNS
ncbi:MAG: electron transfer flavoprotein subunit alpha/FixB family protein, partial [Bacteroidia bacterium]